MDYVGAGQRSICRKYYREMHTFELRPVENGFELRGPGAQLVDKLRSDVAEDQRVEILNGR